MSRSSDPPMVGVGASGRQGSRPGALALDKSARRRRRGIPRVRCSAALDEKKVSLGIGDGPVLDAFGNHEHFAGTETNGAVSQLEGDFPDENQKEVIGVVVFVPNEFTLDLYHQEVVSVEGADDARLPIVRKCREFIGKIDCVHQYHEMLDRASSAHFTQMPKFDIQ